MVQPPSYGYDNGPFPNAVAVTPSDTVPLTTPTRGLYVGTTGNLTVIMNLGTTPVTFSNIPVGLYDKLSVSQVMATGTTASNIVALW